MANITLSELHVSGSELFQDSESFLNELSDLGGIHGGGAYDIFTVYVGSLIVGAGILSIYELASLFADTVTE